MTPSAAKKPRKSEAQLCLEAALEELIAEERKLYWRWRCEFQFSPPRRWRFDYALFEAFFGHFGQSRLLAIEIEGGSFVQGRHNRATGFLADIEKYNEATLAGWQLLRFTPRQVLAGSAKETIKRWLAHYRAP